MASHPHDDLPDWIDHEPPEAGKPGRRPALLVLAVVPWLVVVVLLLRPGAAEPRPPDVAGSRDAGGPDEVHANGDPPAPPAALPGPKPEDAGQEPAAPMPADDVGWWLTEHRGNWRIGPGEGVTAALATVVARAWLTGVDPQLRVDGIVAVDERSYVEHLVVESVERPDTGAAVVTLLAVVLEVGEERAASVQRLAVPIAETSVGARPAGSPWRLPAPDLTPAPLEGEVVEDPALTLAALEAVERGGLGDGGEIELTSLVRTGGWPWIAHVRVHHGSAEQAGAARAWEGAVWLRRHLDGFALTGVPLSADAAEGSGPAPSVPNDAHDTVEVRP